MPLGSAEFNLSFQGNFPRSLPRLIISSQQTDTVLFCQGGKSTTAVSLSQPASEGRGRGSGLSHHLLRNL